MNDPIEITHWDRTAAARRAALASQPVPDDSLPPGFSTRIAARWAELRRNEQFRLWSRWSLRAALGGVLTAMAMTFLFSSTPSGGLRLSVPDVEVPAFTAQ